MARHLTREEVLALVFGLPDDVFGIGGEYDFALSGPQRDERGDAPLAQILPLPSKERR
jgi:hypothetical protein